MLTGITLENFKAFKEPQFIPIKPITLVFGPNSAGKSSIVHALAFLQHVFENKGACDPLTQIVGWETFDLGGFDNLLFGHDASQSNMMSVALDFTKCSACWGFRLAEYGPQFSYFSASIVDPKSPQDKILVEWGDRDMRNSKKITLSENHPRIRDASSQIWNFLCTGRSWESPEDAKVNPVITQEALYGKVVKHLTSKSASLEVNGFIPTYNAQENTRADDDEVEVGFAPPTFQGSEIRQLRYDTHKQLLSNPDNTDPVDQLLDRLNWNGLLTDATLADLAEECEQVFHNRVHLGSTRHPPERKIDVSLSVHEPWRMVLNNEHLRKSINETLEELDMAYKLEVSHIEEIHYKAGHDPNSAQQQGDTRSNVERIQRTKELSFVTKGGVSLSHKDLGHGVSTTLPMLVAIHASNGCFISVEQPELHIHPRIQTVLGDLFIQTSLAGVGCDEYDNIDYEFDCATDMAREFGGFDVVDEDQVFYDPSENNHVLIETHSEHLILRILRRIRETTERKIQDWPETLRNTCPNGVSPENVAVIYVRPGENGSEVIELPVTPDGDFSKSWPDGFFDERFEEYE